MRTTKLKRIFILIGMLLSLKLHAFALPLGSDLSNPIDLGTLISSNTTSDTKSNATANGFGNNYGKPAHDIFYACVCRNSPLKIASYP